MSALSTFFESHFLNASALWWLAALSPLIIILYFLKLKREELTVSSTLLWLQSIQDLRVNAPFQRLRRNILLLLQLLILLIVVLALSRPLMNLEEKDGRKIIVLIDASASMSATDVSGSRLEEAKKGAIDLVENMLKGDQMSVVLFAAQASVLSPFTSDKPKLTSLIQGLKIQETETQLQEALTIAFSLARARAESESSAEIHLFSDGRFSDTAKFSSQDVEVKFHSIGKSSRNVGLVALDVGYATGPSAATEIFFSIENFDVVDAEAEVEFHFNDQLIGAKRIQLDPALRYSGLAPTTGNQEGILEIKITGEDALNVDNTGYAVVRRPPVTKVLLVGKGDFFMKQSLDVAGAEITKLPPSGFTPSMTEKYDIVVFDSWAPTDAGNGSFIFHNCHPSLNDIEIKGEAEAPVLLDWDSTHPLMRFVSLGEVFVLKLPIVKPPKWMKVLAETSEGPMILCSEQEGFRSLYLPFNVSNSSNFSGQGTFPIFILNTIRWLPATEMHRSRQFLTGQSLMLNSRGKDQVRVKSPDGKKHDITAESGRFLFPHTTQTGIYEFEADGGNTQQFAVNLLSPSESKIVPQSEFKIQGADVQAEQRVTKSNREIWHWLAYAAFFMLLFEWYVYNTKVYI